MEPTVSSHLSQSQRGVIMSVYSVRQLEFSLSPLKTGRVPGAGL